MPMNRPSAKVMAVALLAMIVSGSVILIVWAADFILQKLGVIQ